MTPKITKAIVFSENVKISNCLRSKNLLFFFEMKIAQYRNYQKERPDLNELPF